MSDDAFSQAQLQQLRQVFREEIADAGLRLDGPEHLDAAKEDFRFLRKFRQSWDRAVGKIGNAVLISVIAIAGTIIGLGWWAWINGGGK